MSTRVLSVPDATYTVGADSARRTRGATLSPAHFAGGDTARVWTTSDNVCRDCCAWRDHVLVAERCGWDAGANRHGTLPWAAASLAVAWWRAQTRNDAHGVFDIVVLCATMANGHSGLAHLREVTRVWEYGSIRVGRRR